MPPLWPRVGQLLPDKPLMQALEQERALRVNPKLGSFRQIRLCFPFTQTVSQSAVKQKYGFSPARGLFPNLFKPRICEIEIYLI